MKKSVIDLFAGVGGLSQGFRNADFDVPLANEWDPSIAKAYVHNHPDTQMIVEDLTKIDLPSAFRRFRDRTDVVVGGPPCQGFSQKGKRQIIEDERNYLFKYFVEAVRFIEPAAFVMENVPNLLTAEMGLFRVQIEELFDSMGYNVISGVLNAADFGVPQNRRRAIIIGSRIGEVSLPASRGQGTTVWDAISDLAYLESGEGAEVQPYTSSAQTAYQEKMREGSTRLFNHHATHHTEKALQRLRLIPPLGDRTSLPPEHQTKSIYSGTWSRMRPDEKSVTITTRFDTPSSGRFTHPFLNRAVTVREAARLQSFPDNFRFIGNKASQMKQVGNAVPPILGEAIANELKSRKLV